MRLWGPICKQSKLKLAISGQTRSVSIVLTSMIEMGVDRVDRLPSLFIQKVRQCGHAGHALCRLHNVSRQLGLQHQ